MPELGRLNLNLDRRCAPCGATAEEEDRLRALFNASVAARKAQFIDDFYFRNAAEATVARDDALVPAQAKVVELQQRIARIHEKYLKDLEWSLNRAEEMWEEQEAKLWQDFRAGFLKKS